MAQGVSLSRITKSFGPTRVLNDVSLDIREGEFLSLVGASGCGKSTLLRIIAGLEAQDSGTVSINGRPVDHLRPRDRNIAMVFQSYALYPHMTVAENIAMPLTMARLTLAERLPLIRLASPRRGNVMREIHQEVAQVAAQLRIDGLLARKPAQLSGGQRQRVALARAMVRHPAAFLMDEPLSNLDAKLRVHMRDELSELHRRLGATFIYVTHDQIEAMTMSSRVALMEAGEILQVGTPAELYDRPRALKVAQFIGSPVINTLTLDCQHDGSLHLHGRRLGISVPRGIQAIHLAIRPEAVRPMGSRRVEDMISLPGRLRRVEHHGAERILHIALEEGDGRYVACRIGTAESSALVLEEGSAVLLGFSLRDAHLFDTAGRRVDPLQEAPVDMRVPA